MIAYSVKFLTDKYGYFACVVAVALLCINGLKMQNRKLQKFLAQLHTDVAN